MAAVHHHEGRFPPVPRLLPALREGGVLNRTRSGRGRRATILAFPELLNIAEGRRAF